MLRCGSVGRSVLTSVWVACGWSVCSLVRGNIRLATESMRDGRRPTVRFVGRIDGQLSVELGPSVGHLHGSSVRSVLFQINRFRVVLGCIAVPYIRFDITWSTEPRTYRTTDVRTYRPMDRTFKSFVLKNEDRPAWRGSRCLSAFQYRRGGGIDA